MRFLLKLVLCLIVLLPFALVAAVYFAVEKTALIETHVKLTAAEIGRAKAILNQHDPRDLRDGEVRTVTIRKRDLGLAVNYFVYLVGRGGAVVELSDGSVKVQATARLPKVCKSSFVSMPSPTYARMTPLLSSENKTGNPRLSRPKIS